MVHHRFIALASCACIGIMACHKTPEQAQQHAAEARREAEAKQAKAFEAYERSAAQAQAEAADKAGAALNVLAEAQKGLDDATEAKLAKSEKRVSDLRATLATAPSLGLRRSEIEKKIDAVTVKLAKARSTLSDARTASDATEFAGAKTRLESELAAIERELTTLEKHV